MTATGPDPTLVDRFLSGDPAVWRPTLDELVTRIWPRPSQQRWQALEAVAVGREAASEPRGGTAATSTPIRLRVTSDKPPKTYDGTCQACGCMFAATRADADLCSPRCRKRASRARHGHGQASSQATILTVLEAGRRPA